jgi:hypothetical protein
VGRNQAARRAWIAETVAFMHARSRGTPTARRRRSSDSGDGAASDRCAVGRRLYGAARRVAVSAWPGAARGALGGGSALTSRPGVERERLTSGTPQWILFRIKNTT